VQLQNREEDDDQQEEDGPQKRGEGDKQLIKKV
jgi:hypothetical protein